MKKLSLLALMVSSMAFASGNLTMKNTFEKTSKKNSKTEYTNETVAKVDLTKDVDLEAKLKYNNLTHAVDGSETNVRVGYLHKFGRTDLTVFADKGLALGHTIGKKLGEDTTVYANGTVYHNFRNVENELKRLREKKSKGYAVEIKDMFDLNKNNALVGVVGVNHNEGNLKTSAKLKVGVTKDSYKLMDKKVKADSVGAELDLNAKYMPVENVRLEGKLVYGQERFNTKETEEKTKTTFKKLETMANAGYDFKVENLTVTPMLQVSKEIKTAMLPKQLGSLTLKSDETKVGPKVKAMYNFKNGLTVDSSLGYDKIYTTAKVNTLLGTSKTKIKTNGVVGTLGFSYNF